jgi:type IV secretory pathway VirB4 component
MPKNFANTQDLVDLEAVRENTVVLKSGGLRQVLMVSGVNFSLKSEEEQNLITSAYQNFLNSIDFPIQVLIHSRKINIQRYLDDLERRKQEEPAALLQNQIGEYREFIRQFVEENAIMEKTFMAVVPWQPVSLTAKGGILDSIPFFGKKGAEAEKKQAAEGEADFQQNLVQLSQRTNQVVEGLSAIGLESVLLNDEQLIELFYNFYNPETVEKENLPMEKN